MSGSLWPHQAVLIAKLRHSAGTTDIARNLHTFRDWIFDLPTFDYRFRVEAPLQAVQEFHRDTRALRRLTPPPTLVQLHSVEPLAEGSVSKFTLWVGPLPLVWTAVHRNVSAHGFTDVQTAGPVHKWEHTHRFTPLGETETEIHEHIEFEHKSGAWGLLTRLLFAYPNLYLMFTYRKLVTRWHLRHQAPLPAKKQP